MDAEELELDYELFPLMRAYKDGRIERLVGEVFVPPTTDPQAEVASKDVTIDPQIGITARLFLPRDHSTTNSNTTNDSLSTTTKKLPLVVYFHGGAFIVSSPFEPATHNYLSILIPEAHVVGVSVHYRRAPEHPIPTAYEDSRVALRWIAFHREGSGPEEWLNQHVDFERVFLVGDSCGANIIHNIALTPADEDSSLDMKIHGLVLVHPFFWGSTAIGSEPTDPDVRVSIDKVWPIVCPSSMPVPGQDDPWINPFVVGAPRLANLRCRKVLVVVAEMDALRERGRLYYETLRNSGWDGAAEIEESEGGHSSHLINPTTEVAKKLIKTLAAFLHS
ncbi:hypothetical protein Droror1_Dr00027867 [Drosera rotundifolia]